MDTTPTTFETDITKLPRSARGLSHGDGEKTCFCCGKTFARFAAVMVMTEQGGYAVGTDCAKKCEKLGFEIEAHWA